MISNDKLEKGVISTLISDDSLLIEFFKDLNPNLFYNAKNVIVIKAILELKDKSIIPDYDALENHLAKQSIPVDVYEYTEPLNVRNFADYINQLKELTYKRELKLISTKLFTQSDQKQSDVFELDAELNQAATKLTNIITTNEIEDNVSLMRKVIKEIEAAKQNKGITGCLTGFTEIDSLTGGWQKGDLIILAARPAMGKTSLAIGQALNAAIDYDKNIIFFSLEMSSTQLMKRQFSLVSDIPLQNFSNDTELDFAKLNNGISPLANSFKLFDKCFSLYDIKAQCRRENQIKKLDAIYIDYLQLIKHSVGQGRSKENEVSEISRELKLLAKELEVPIVCLSQLSRAVENRGGEKIPMLSDLRDSGSIEQDADIVTFLYRPEYYGIMEDEEGQSTAKKAVLIFAKNRNGATQNIKLRFEAELTRFSTLTETINISNNSIEPNKLDWLND
jgi:replicative DNA helicase